MTTPDPDREIYPSAPLKLVAFEFRFDEISLEAPGIAAFRDALADEFPIVGTAPQRVVFAPSGPQTSDGGTQCFSVDRRHSVLLTPESLGVQTARYGRFEEFREVIARTVDALIALGMPLVAARVGLRYIDEIDEQLLPTPVQWSTYIEPALAGAIEHFEHPPSEYQAASLFEPDASRRVLLRYGVMRQPAVDPAGPLVIDQPPRGRYFLIDIDSSWSRIESPTETTQKEWLLDMLGTLHAPIRDLFERTVTDALRDEFLRKERS